MTKDNKPFYNNKQKQPTNPSATQGYQQGQEQQGHQRSTNPTKEQQRNLKNHQGPLSQGKQSWSQNQNEQHSPYQNGHTGQTFKK